MNHILLKQDPNIGSPKFRPNESPARFPLATGKSKLCYERALARALYNARAKPMGAYRPAIRYSGSVSCAADNRLFQRIYAWSC